MDELLGHVLEGLMIGLAVVCHGRIVIIVEIFRMPMAKMSAEIIICDKISAIMTSFVRIRHLHLAVTTNLKQLENPLSSVTSHNLEKQLCHS